MSFTVDLSRLVAKSKGKVELAIKKVALETFQRVVMKSPVDTGRFRANWVYSVSNYPTTTSAGIDKSGAGTIGKIAIGLSATQINGQMLYLTNSLPYAQRLENGWSKQAPAGMVKLTLLEITSKYGT